MNISLDSRSSSSFFSRLQDTSQQIPSDNEMSLIQRRRNRHSQANPEASVLVLPRPRPFSDISTESNSDAGLSPPLTPPLVGAKPPVSIYC